MKTTRILRATATCLALWLTTAGLLPAQDRTAAPPADEFGESIEVSEVLLDVLVTDRAGNVILGLDKDDFVVRENGKEVALESLSFYSNRLLEDPATVVEDKGLAVDRAPRDRYFILFFDDARIENVEASGVLSRQLDAARQAKRWIRTELVPGDWVAVVSYDVKLKLHQDFTLDRGSLVDAIDRATAARDPGNWPSRQPEAGAPSLAAGLPQGKKLRDKTETIYEGLQALAHAAGSVSARKNLVLFSTGFGDFDSFGQYRPDARYFPPTMKALNDNNVAVYAIDLTPSGFKHVMADALNHLANETGGEYLFNFTSFMTPLRRVAEANSGYYLLSYQSRRPAKASGYQEVQVETRVPGLKVKARAGYLYGASEG